MSSARQQYEELLVQLHREMRAGRGDEESAHQIRDKMGESWAALENEERELLDALSEDLYIIEGKRMVVPLGEGETIDTLSVELSLAFRAERYRDVLAQIRKLTDFRPHHAYVVARCWENLGFLRGAVCFFDLAYEQQRKSVYAVAALEALFRSGQATEAVGRVNEIEKRTGVDATLLLEAASVLHRVASASDSVDKVAFYGRVVRMVEAAWIDSSALPSLRASGLLSAGFSYEHLGRSADALRAFERAVAVYPRDLTLIAHGLALFNLDRRQAVALFTRAARLRTQFDWPYLYAAKSAMDEQRFAEVEQFCDEGLLLAERAELRGRFYEWSAIAAVHLGRPHEEVKERFDRALSQLPLDPTVRKNAAAFAEFSGTPLWTMASSEDAIPPTILGLERGVALKRARSFDAAA